MIRQGGLTCLLAAALAATAGCGSQGGSSANGRLTVVVSVGPQAWLVEQIGGEAVEVVTLTGPGDSPVTYQPTDAQVSRIMTASVYFRVGVPFENGSWFEALDHSNKLSIVDTRQGLSLRDMAAHAHPGEADAAGHDHDHDHGHGADSAAGKDPHVWLSPKRLKMQARTVADELSRIDPESKATYQTNLAALETRCDETDAALRTALEPYRGRAFFVFHPAWGYFADDYGLRQMAVEVEGKEPSDRQLTDLQRQARASGARVIFVQPQIPGQAAHAVAEAIDGRVERLDPLAPDVLANLEKAAEALARSFGETDQETE